MDPVARRGRARRVRVGACGPRRSHTDRALAATDPQGSGEYRSELAIVVPPASVLRRAVARARASQRTRAARPPRPGWVCRSCREPVVSTTCRSVSLTTSKGGARVDRSGSATARGARLSSTSSASSWTRCCAWWSSSTISMTQRAFLRDVASDAVAQWREPDHGILGSAFRASPLPVFEVDVLGRVGSSGRVPPRRRAGRCMDLGAGRAARTGLALAGERDRSIALFEKVTSYANDVGLVNAVWTIGPSP